VFALQKGERKGGWIMREFERGVTVVLALWSALILLGYSMSGIGTATCAKSETYW
jgi:hypothetical protein